MRLIQETEPDGRGAGGGTPSARGERAARP